MENEETIIEETSNEVSEETIETSKKEVKITKKPKSSKKPNRRLPGIKELYCPRCGGITKHSLYNPEEKTYMCLNCNTINK